MLSYFLHIMRQKSGGSSFVCVQLLQTLNILFENIRNETSLCKYQCFSKHNINKWVTYRNDLFCFYRLSFEQQSCQFYNCAQV